MTRERKTSDKREKRQVIKKKRVSGLKRKRG
jgi:hypothetical protein